MSAEELPPRESMEFDVVIVGAGPSGLAAAIRLKQLNADLSIVVVEKGSEVGAHILSGAVIDPVSLDKLIPDWREDADCPLKTAGQGRPLLLDDRGAARSGCRTSPMPPLMNNHHCYIGSLGNVCRWLAPKAEALGVEIYPGFAAAEVLYDDNGAVRGIATGDMGIARDGSHKDSYTRGMELLGKYTLFAEGARGSLTKQLIAKFSLDANSEPPKFGIGLKEVWEIDPAKHQKGLIQHSFGWPLNNSTGGGSFLYHYDDNKVAVGFVVHLNYDDPYLSPFDEFQRFKTHPSIRTVFEGGKRLAYGARAITEGGYQSVPRLSFPGGALIGCAAGFVNVPRIKGVHNAMGSGMLAAEHVAAALGAGRANDELVEYENAWRDSAVGKDLYRVRNVKPLFAQTPEHTGDNAAQFPSKTDLKALTTSGSYLAARHASVERDAASAAAFYRSALRTDPKNNELLDRAFISSLADGDIDEAVKLADRILTMDKANRVARLVVGVRDLKQKKYAAAQLNINQSIRGPITDLVATLLSGWASYGAGDAKAAVARYRQADRP